MAGKKDQITVPGRAESDESEGDSDDDSDGSDFENGSLKCTTGRQFTVAEKIEILDYYRGEGIYLFVVYYSYSSDTCLIFILNILFYICVIP